MQANAFFVITFKIRIIPRHYLTSLKGNAKFINNSVRTHWGIENQLHWNLDVFFNED